jgi:hypothetical protein
VPMANTYFIGRTFTAWRASMVVSSIGVLSMGRPNSRG